jgi:phosphocarrier protein FPr/phosphocarrier protein
MTHSISQARLILRCPLSGWVASLDEAPDPVFAQRMLGDGVLIDPLGSELCAPCDGEIISIAASKHAIAIRADNGAEVIMHVGIDTVSLAGEGFELLVTQGARVKAGAPLLKFDLDLLARKAKSLVTPVIVTNGDQFELMNLQMGREVVVGDELFQLKSLATGTSAQASTAQLQAVETIRVEHEHGIHARPAALIANQAKKLACDVEISAHG